MHANCQFTCIDCQCIYKFCLFHLKMIVHSKLYMKIQKGFLEIWHTVTSETHFYTHVNAKVIHITSPWNSQKHSTYSVFTASEIFSVHYKQHAMIRRSAFIIRSSEYISKFCPSLIALPYTKLSLKSLHLGEGRRLCSKFHMIRLQFHYKI